MKKARRHSRSAGVVLVAIVAAAGLASLRPGTVLADTTPPVITCPADVTLECPADTCPVTTGGATAQDAVSGGGSNWLAVFGGHYYEFVEESLTWPQARDAAVAAGGYLVIINTAAENEFVASQVPDCATGVWLGASDAAGEGDWRWGDGSSVFAGYQNWAPSQPDNIFDQDAMWMAVNDVSPSWTTGQWDDEEYGDTFPNVNKPNIVIQYVIEYDAPPANAVAVSYSDSVVTGCASARTITRTWTAADQAGNATSCVQTIAVVDTAPPAIVCPGDATVESFADTDPTAAPGPVLHYSFDSDEGGTVSDSSGFGNHGTVFNAVFTPGGKFGGGFEFDGSGDWINAGDHSSLQVSGGDFTVAAWVKTTGFVEDIVGNTTTPPGGFYLLMTYLGIVRAHVWSPDNAGLTVVNGSAIVNDGQWHHVAQVVEGDKLIVYVDGVKDAETTITVDRATAVTPVYIGNRDPVVHAHNFDGTIDEVQIYGRALSVAEIADVMTGTPSVGVGAAVAREECGDVAVTYSDVTEQTGTTTTITRTWTATDECGLSSSCDQTIVVDDRPPPEIACPVDVTVVCGADSSPTATGTASSSGGCGGTEITYSDVVSGGAEEGLILHYNFDEDEGGIVTDQSGSGYQGAVHNASWTGSGYLGGAYDYDGYQDHISSPVTIQGLSEFTVSAWVYARSISSPQRFIVSFSANPFDCGRAFVHVGSADRAIIFNVADQDDCNAHELTRTPGNGLPLNGWHHVVAVFNASTDTHTIYVDGAAQAVGSFAVNPIPDTDPDIHMEIGVNPSPRWYHERWWNGLIDEVRVYNRALTAEQTASLHRDGTTGGSFGCTQVITRVWTATDECGNSSSCTQTITAVDTTPPAITCPADRVLECPADTSVAANGSATASDACGNVTITNADSVVSSCGDSETVTRVWTATDDCGNSSSCTQTITVVDTTVPVIACNATNIAKVKVNEHRGDDDDDVANGAVRFTATATEACGTATVEIADFACFVLKKDGEVKRQKCDVEIDGDTITILKATKFGMFVTWTVIATDACGNVSTEVCEIEVVSPFGDDDDDW